MQSKCKFALYVSPLAMAALEFAGLSFAGKFPQAQSAQQAAPPLLQRPDQTKPLDDRSIQQETTAAELSKKETVASALLRSFQFQEYQVRSAAEAMPEEKYGFRPAEGKFKNEKPEFGPAEMRTFAQQVKHVACANFAFAAELDGQNPPAGCDKDGPSPAKTKKELLSYLRDSFAAARKSLGAIDAKTCSTPSKAPTRGPIRTSAWLPSSSGTAPTTMAKWFFTCARTISFRQPAARTRRLRTPNEYLRDISCLHINVEIGLLV
jgi:hypothetical protein